jgi:hypothetical protein
MLKITKSSGTDYFYAVWASTEWNRKRSPGNLQWSATARAYDRQQASHD